MNIQFELEFCDCVQFFFRLSKMNSIRLIKSNTIFDKSKNLQFRKFVFKTRKSINWQFNVQKIGNYFFFLWNFNLWLLLKCQSTFTSDETRWMHSFGFVCLCVYSFFFSFIRQKLSSVLLIQLCCSMIARSEKGSFPRTKVLRNWHQCDLRVRPVHCVSCR